MSRSSVIVWFLRLALAAVYLFAAIPKILDPWGFARAIWNYRLLPLGMIPPLAIWLPVLEGIAAVAVLTGIAYRGGVACLTALSILFAGGIVSAIARGLDIECGCFGKAATSSAGLAHLGLNVAIVAAGIILLAAAARSRRRDRSRAPAPGR